MLVRRNAFCFHFIRSLIIAFICVSFFLIALQAQEATPSASMPAPEVTKPQITQTPSMQAMSSTFESEVKKESPLTSIGKEADALSLQKCFELAAIRSDTLKISEESIHAAQARLIQAIAELFPTINLVNNQNFQNTYPVKGSAAPIRPYGSSTQLTISQPIFNGFSNYNAIGSANADKANQRHTLQRNYQLLYQDVAQAFYQIISNEGDLIILQQSITTLDSRVKELGDRVKIARSRPSELMQARADLASQKVSLEETKGLLAAAKELMAFYLGIPSEKIHLRETTPFPSVQVLEKYMQTTGTRPDILALVDAERKAQRDVSIEKGALWPQISATGSYNLTNDPGVPEEWAAGFQVQLPLFDGGLIYGRIQEKK
ncbi:MAG: TolC family protein, partial [Verrucomicrobiota bacterium]